MNSLLALVVVVCVANGAMATGCFGGCSEKPEPSSEGVDFHGLETYAAEHQWFSKPSNLLAGRLMSSVGKMTGGIKRAADILIALSKNENCNDDVLATLTDAQSRGLNSDKFMGSKTVARYVISPALSTCSRYVDQELKTRMRSVSPSLKGFLQVANPLDMTGFTMDPSNAHPLEAHLDFYSILGGHRRRLNVDQLTEIVKQLSRDEPKAVDSKDQIDELAINKYLLAPCKELQQTLGNLLEATRAMALLSSNRYVFVAGRSIEFRNIAWTYMACDYILGKANTTRVVSLDQL